MNELNNIVTAVGNYNNILTTLTSNTSVVNIIEGLSLHKEAGKTNWGGGNLEYTITIDNQTDKIYVKPIITDVIDTTLVDFIDGSVEINGVIATQNQYNYNEATHTLTVNLDDVTPSSNSTFMFSVKKKD